MKNYSESELDALIAGVDEVLAKASYLSKSSLKKDDMPPQEDQAQPEEEAAPAPEQEQPEMAAPAPEQEQPEMAAPAPEQEAQPQEEQQPEEQPEQQLEEEQEDAPLTDEELSQIYGSMDRQELERHYSVIRQALQSAYGQEEQQAAPQEQPEETPEQPEEQEQPEQQDEMEKSEKIIALEKQVQEQAHALAQITKAFEVLAKPSRKSITDIQFVAKSEMNSNKQLSKEEIKAEATKLSRSTSLTKNEREMINTFFLYGEGQQEIEKLINSKGGNK